MTHDNAPIKDESGFSEFGLADSIIKSLQNEGFTAPTAIQSMALPPLNDGHDLIGIAQTGGGKTAAFSLPTINKLVKDYRKPRQNMPKVLILGPTRELAMQIEQCIVTFSKGTKLKSLVVAGGQPYPPQTNKLRRGVDILVATPGRLVDHIGRRNVKFDDTHTFILDEADRMLDMGFIDDVRDIADSLPEGHQTILFSATMNQKVRNLTRDLLNDPVNVEIEKKTAVADTISHKLMNVSRKNKPQLLADILSGDDVEKALVFARTKLGADDLSKVLYERGIRSDAIHGDKRQRVREKILMNFRRGRTKVLVATDVAARGIDVDGITHVINYELPIEPENYVHRVGRTGRAGEKGIAISFCDPSDVRLLVQIEKLIKHPIDVDEDHEFHIDVTARGKGKGNKGRFSRDRGGRREGGFGRNARPEGRFKRDNKDDRPKSDRYKSRDNVKAANSDWKDESRAKTSGKSGRFKQRDNAKSNWNDEDRDTRRSSSQKKHSKPVRHENRPARKEGKRYDPWTTEAKNYADDPVLGKLIGKPPVIKSNKEEKSDFVKTGTKKKNSFKKKEGDAKPFERKKVRGGKKALDAKRPGKPSKSQAKGKGRDNTKGNTKNNGGNKTFSPKRKILRATKVA